MEFEFESMLVVLSCSYHREFRKQVCAILYVVNFRYYSSKIHVPDQIISGTCHLNVYLNKKITKPGRCKVLYVWNFIYFTTIMKQVCVQVILKVWKEHGLYPEETHLFNLVHSCIWPINLWLSWSAICTVFHLSLSIMRLHELIILKID